MIRTLRACGAIALGAAALSCGGEPVGPGVEPITELPRALSADELQAIDGSNRFAFRFLREAQARDTSYNTFLSPLSVSMALGMTMNGAAGESWTQMRHALGFQGMEEQAINEAYRELIALLVDLDPAVEVVIGNSIWSDESRVALLPDFVERVNTYFSAQAATLDFSDPGAKDVMNDWVAEATNGRIPGLIDEIPTNAVAYLINAVYFLADWRTTFDRSRTYQAPFTRTDGSEVVASYMSDGVGYRVLNAGDPRVPQGVELPYGGGAFSAVAVLPPEGQGVHELVAGLDASIWNGWMEHFDAMAETEDLDREGARVDLPKFELDWKGGLIPALRALGMVDVFDPGGADFSRMNGGRDLFITRVLHQTFVRVDEEGTEAAAATAVEMGRTSAPPMLRFDRPFLFVIRERYSGAILFMGVIGDPSVRGE